jgi:hypothetical protein
MGPPPEDIAPVAAPALPLDGELTRAMVPNVRDLGPNIVVAGIFPFIGYLLLRPHVGSDATALAAVMIFPILEIGFERRRRGRFEPIGIIALVGIALGIISAIATGGDALLLKIRESAITGLFGVACLGSLVTKRPLMWYLGREFATGGAPDKREAFDQIWETPGAPHRFRVVTAVWGFGLLGEAVGRTTLALTLSTSVFLIVSFVFNGAVLVGLFAFTIGYSRSAERKTRTEMERLGMDTTAIAESLRPS